MNVLKRNIIANLAGNFWQAIMAIVFVPFYIKFMGIESYGLIGIFTTIQAVLSLLDLGFGATINREMARLSVRNEKAQDMRNLVRSLEIIYWCIAGLIGLFMFFLAPYIAYYWIKPGQLPTSTIVRTFVIMGSLLAIQWPLTLYSGGLMGLQRQVSLNIFNICIGTFRGVSTVFVLWMVSATIDAFFIWQLIVSSVNVIVIAIYLWRVLPASERKASFQRKLLQNVWRFAAGMSGITILSTILTQMDKIILSKMLSLEMFGYYSLASMIALTIYRLIGPVFSSVYPRLTQLVSLNDQVGLKQLYHQSCQLMSVIILPVSVVVSFFSYDVLLLWTQNPTTAENTHIILSILVIGTAMNGLMNMPYALQLAHGWTKLSLYTNLISVILLVPLLIIMTNTYGATGGASIWLILNCIYILMAIPVMHKYLLPAEKWRWYLDDVGKPLIVAFLITGIGRFLISTPMTFSMAFLSLFILVSITFLMTALSTPTTRIPLFQLIKLTTRGK